MARNPCWGLGRKSFVHGLNGLFLEGVGDWGEEKIEPRKGTEWHGIPVGGWGGKALSTDYTDCTDFFGGWRVERKKELDRINRMDRMDKIKK
jgi:hypothetical protein